MRDTYQGYDPIEQNESTIFKTRVPEYKGPDVGNDSAASSEYHRLRDARNLVLGSLDARAFWAYALLGSYMPMIFDG